MKINFSRNGSSSLAVILAIAFICAGVIPGALAQPIVPDNGSGTATLPLPVTYYGGSMFILSGLPAGTTIDIQTPELAPPISITSPEAAGGTLGGTTTEFVTELLSMDLVGTGLLAGFNRSLTLSLPIVSYDAAPRVSGDPIQSFNTVLMLLQGQLPAGDPDFDLLRITAGSGFGLPSPGDTTLTQSGGDWAVESFFDVTYRIDFVGHPGGALSGMSGSTTGTVRFETLVPEASNVGAIAALALIGIRVLFRRRLRAARL